MASASRSTGSPSVVAYCSARAGVSANTAWYAAAMLGLVLVIDASRATTSARVARSEGSAALGANAREVVFTSGATESNNLAIKGAAHFYQSRGKHLITVKTEHKAVLDTMRELERQGFDTADLQAAVVKEKEAELANARREPTRD